MAVPLFGDNTGGEMPKIVTISLLAACAAWAQTGSIEGRILTTAGAGAPVSKAPVRVKSTTGASYAAQSAADGSYRVNGLPVGAYEVSIEYPPFFLPFHQDKVRVDEGKAARVDVRLNDVTLNTLGDGGVEFAWLLADHPAPTSPPPHTSDGRPDLSGVWLPSPPVPVGEAADPLPWAAALIKKRSDGTFTDNPTAHCLPIGVAGAGLFDEFRILQTPALMAVNNGGFNPPREIYLDGRGHPKEMNPSWMGHSVGHWEGDALVVDTVGFNDRGWLTLFGNPQTEQLQITERYRRVDLGHLEVELTIEDPGAYKRPWKLKRVNSLAPNSEEILEYVCAENNRDPQHMGGK